MSREIMFPDIHRRRTIRAKGFDYSPLRGPSMTIGAVVRGFKIGVTKWFRQNRQEYQVWQRNYYEHIIRDDKDLNRVRQYVIDNPINWEKDELYAL